MRTLTVTTVDKDDAHDEETRSFPINTASTDIREVVEQHLRDEVGYDDDDIDLMRESDAWTSYENHMFFAGTFSDYIYTIDVESDRKAELTDLLNLVEEKNRYYVKPAS